MFYPKFTIITDHRTFEVTASNKFRAEDIAKAQLTEAERIVRIERKHPKLRLAPS